MISLRMNVSHTSQLHSVIPMFDYGKVAASLEKVVNRSIDELKSGSATFDKPKFEAQG